MSDFEQVFSLLNEMISKVDNQQVLDISLLGEGGFGSVYKIEAMGVSKESRNSDDKNSIETIDTEIVSWAEKEMRLFNDNIVSQNIREANFYKKFSNDGMLFSYGNCFVTKNIKTYSVILNMPLMNGTMKEYVKKHSITDRIQNFKKVFLPICEALLYMHSNNIYHIDIKPLNILMNFETLETKLADFSGVKFEINDTTEHTSTISYRPPELFPQYENYKKLSNYKKFNSHNDIWSLGLTMLYYLTGENRSDSFEDPDSISTFVNRKKPYPVRKILAEHTIDYEENKEISKIIESMLVRNHTRRIRIRELYKKLGGDLKVFYSKFKKVYNEESFENIIDSEDRNVSIKKQYEYCLEEHEIVRHSFALGVSICDRYCFKSGEKYSSDLLGVCIYIATFFLTDKYINLKKRMFLGKFKLKSKIVMILQVLEFDIYRPTLYSYIQKRVKIGSIGKEVLYRMMRDVEYFKKDFKQLYHIYKHEVKKQRNKNNDKNINYWSFSKLVGSIANKQNKIITFTASKLNNQKVKQYIDYIVYNKILYKFAEIGRTKFPLAVIEKLESIKNKNINNYFKVWADRILKIILSQIGKYL